MAYTQTAASDSMSSSSDRYPQGWWQQQGVAAAAVAILSSRLKLILRQRLRQVVEGIRS